MATKRFDDATKKARALEAQAKRVRLQERERQGRRHRPGAGGRVKYGADADKQYE